MHAQFIVFCAECDILHHASLLMFMKVLVTHFFDVILLLSINFVLFHCIPECAYLTKSILKTKNVLHDLW